MRQLLIGQYNVIFNFLDLCRVEEFLDKGKCKRLTINALAWQWLGQNQADDELMHNISVDRERMKGSMQTTANRKQKRKHIQIAKNHIIRILRRTTNPCDTLMLDVSVNFGHLS